MKDGIAAELHLKLPTAVGRETAKRLRRKRTFKRGISGRYRSDELMRVWKLRVAGSRSEATPLRKFGFRNFAALGRAYALSSLRDESQCEDMD